MTSTRNGELHVVMLPWCAFGHTIPFLELSKSLATAGVSVSFVSTPRNIQRLPELPPHLEALVKLVELPMPSLEDETLLPPGAEATVDLPTYDAIQHLKTAYDLLEKPFRELVAAVKADWIIADVLPHWAADVSVELGVPLMMFSIFPAHTMLFLGPPEYLAGEGQRRVRGSPESLMHPPEWGGSLSSFAFRRFEAEGLHAGLFGGNASGMSDAGRLAKMLQVCRAVAVRSCSEIEGKYVDPYAKLIGRDVIPVGLLPRTRKEVVEAGSGIPQTRKDDVGAGITEKEAVGAGSGIPKTRKEVIRAVSGDGAWDWDKTFQWLDNQRNRSVVFVVFGSEVKLTKEQVTEIARGLELSEIPFLWAMRRPSWAEGDEDMLPPGFDRRTAGRGVVTMGWAPQMEIISHRAIRGCMIQSGWSSVIETLQFGHCLVLLPFIIDQGLIARFLVDMGVAVEVRRGEDGSFVGGDIADSLRLVMVEEAGEAVRVKAREAGEVFGDIELHQRHYINGFVEYLKHGSA